MLRLKYKTNFLLFQLSADIRTARWMVLRSRTCNSQTKNRYNCNS